MDSLFFSQVALFLQIACIILCVILILRVYYNKKRTPSMTQIFLSLFFLMHLISLVASLVITISENNDQQLLLVLFIVAFYFGDLTTIIGYIFVNITFESSKSYFNNKKNVYFILILLFSFLIINILIIFNPIFGIIEISLNFLLSIFMILKLIKIHLEIEDDILKVKCKLLIIGLILTQILSNLLFLFITDVDINQYNEIIGDPITLFILVLYFIFLMIGLILIELSFLYKKKKLMQ